MCNILKDEIERKREKGVVLIESCQNISGPLVDGWHDVRVPRILLIHSSSLTLGHLIISLSLSLSSSSFFLLLPFSSLRTQDLQTKKKKFGPLSPLIPSLTINTITISFSLPPCTLSSFSLARAHPALHHRAARAPSSRDRATAVKLEPPRAREDAGE